MATDAIAIGKALAHRFDDKFGLGSGDQHGRGDLELEAPEFADACNERDRLAMRAAVDECLIIRGEAGGLFVAAVRQQSGAIPPQRMACKHFGVERGSVRGQASAG